MQQVLPHLYCPFKPAINDYVQLADQHTFDWLHQFNLLPNEAAYERYRSQGFAYMVARMFPTAEQEALSILTDINTLLFLIDDQIDHITSGSLTESGHLDSFVEKFMSVLINDESLSLTSGNEYLAALCDFWKRVKNISDKNWQNVFIAGIQKTFNSALWQINNIRNDQTPKLDSYIQHRQYLGAANIATDSISIAEKIFLPADVMAHPIISELVNLCRNTVCWANDLYSLKKELAHNDFYNLVPIMQAEHNLSLDAAINQVTIMHNQEVKQFQQLAISAKTLPELAHLTTEVERYIMALSAIMRGNIDWSENETTRYVE
jgi:hypothetical protein